MGGTRHDLPLSEYFRSSSRHRERADKAIADMRRMAFEIDALRATLPSVAPGFLQRWRGYDLEKATKGLTGLPTHSSRAMDRKPFSE